MIDLHCVKHQDVKDIMIDACSKRDTPFVVITGNSSIMKRIVSFAVAKFWFRSKRNAREIPAD